MDENFEPKPKDGKDHWAAEKSTHILEATTMTLALIREHEELFPEIDQEWLYSNLHSTIRNAAKLLSHALYGDNQYTEEWAIRIFEGGRDEVDNFQRALGVEIPIKEEEKHLTPSTVREIIALADQLYPPGQFGSSKALSGEDLMNEFMREMKEGQPHRKRLFDRLQALSPTEKAELMALMWVGRDHEDPDDWKSLVKHAIENSDDAENYVLSKAPLADYLRTGMEIMHW